MRQVNPNWAQAPRKAQGAHVYMLFHSTASSACSIALQGSGLDGVSSEARGAHVYMLFQSTASSAYSTAQTALRSQGVPLNSASTMSGRSLRGSTSLGAGAPGSFCAPGSAALSAQQRAGGQCGFENSRYTRSRPTPCSTWRARP